ncbi:MAG: MetS family NSS transporter small subunit [Spartobacteria bacterium]|nr:MetS family NSS transporter small subunit [Spartobacteria bacterium]
MSYPALIIMIAGLLLTWGGALVCLLIALRKNGDTK